MKHMYKNLRISIIVVLITAAGYNSQAQNVNSSDDLLIAGRTAIVEEKDYRKAITLLRRANEISPNYNDVKILLGRAYQLNNNVDSARHFYNDARRKAPANTDLLNYIIGLEYNAGNVSGAIANIDSALALNPMSEELHLKKSSMLFGEKRYNESQQAVNTLLKINSKNEKAIRLNNQLNFITAANRVSVYYHYSSFDKLYEPCHSTSLSYMRTTERGSIGGHVSYINRSNGLAGYQYELEAYPKVSRTIYGNFALAVSSGDPVFPEFTARGALYKAVKAYEFEGGMRYVRTPAEKFFIYNAGISKYVSNFLLNFKAYLLDFEGTSGQGFQLSSRYYYSENPNNVFIIGAGTGLAPDLANRSLGIANVANLSGRRIFSEYRRVIGLTNILSLHASAGHDEYTATKSANQITVGLGYQRKF